MKTLKEWAELINGRQYGEELTRAEEKELKEQGFVVVFGASYESIIFCGVIDDEKNIYDDESDAYITPEGELFANECEDEHCPYAYKQTIKCKRIRTVDENGVLEITSEIPNEPFIIIYNEKLVACTGIIFDIKDVKQLFELADEDKNNLKPVKIQQNWILKNQLAKIREEYSEVEILVLARELGNNGITSTDIAEELVDLQTACETMLAMLGFDGVERNAVRLNVIEKNRKRGYYNDFVNANKMEK